MWPAPDSLDRITLLLPAFLLLAAACVTDIRARRIPNWLTASLAVAGLFVSFLRGGAWAAFAGLGGVAVGIVLLYAPFALGMMGGGDVKLTAAAGAFLGPIGAVKLVLGSALAGGVVSLVCLLLATATERANVRANLTTFVLSTGGGRIEALQHPTELRRGVPYGVSIAVVAGVLIALGG